MPSPRKLPAIVSEITEHAPGVYTLTLRPEGRTPPFRAGQFLHLAIDPYSPEGHWPESRVFSIANSPRRSETLKITYAVKGQFTRRMAAELVQGGTVWIKLPYGSFTLNPSETREVVLIAGGTGISPFVSFIESLCDEAPGARVRLFYGARQPEFFTHLPPIREAEEKIVGFQSHLFVENPGDSPDPALRVGRLDISTIWELVENPASAIYYLSGPPPMIRAFREQLHSRGVTPADVRVDDWE